MAPESSSLTSLKAKHLKEIADENLKDKNFRAAWEGYSDILHLGASGISACKLLCNRSRAYAGALRYNEALQDACSAVAINSSWAKAHWRKAVAFRGLKRMPEAVQAFHQASCILKGDQECEQALWAAIQRLTQEQLGQGILDSLSRSISQAGMPVQQVEAVSDVEMTEACYDLLRAEHKRKPRPGVYYSMYRTWLQHGICGPEAFVLRAQIHKNAKCYLQAREDALSAIALLKAHPLRRPACCPESSQSVQLRQAYSALGEAYMAESQHVDRDCSQALKAYMQGLDADSDCQDLVEKRTDAERELSSEQIEAVMTALYGAGRYGIAQGGHVSFNHARQPTFIVDISLTFPQASHQKFTNEARNVLRRALADSAAAKASSVAIEGVQRAKAGIRVALTVATGADVLAAQRLVRQLQENAWEAVGGRQLEELVGPLDASCTEAAVQGGTAPGQDSTHAAEHAGPSNEEKSIVPAARPKLEMELPYKMYRLVKADGTLCERIDKHPFAMSRVYYSSSEKPEEVWAELADGSCRWRQTGSEIKIICLKVPSEVSSKDLDVSLQPFNIWVAHRLTNEVYLEGELERGIVPLESAWMHDHGEGEDGCLLLLQKMNLELLQRHWVHSEMWWPRLFRHHGEIAWDDYEKDYSDLPREVLEPHAIAELERDVVRQVEGADKDRREILQERDDLRKRTRQDRLDKMRFNTFKAHERQERQKHAAAIATQ